MASDRARRSCSRLILAALVAIPLVVAALPIVAVADDVDAYLAAEMAKRRIPGLALAVIRGGAVVKMQGYGFANLEHAAPVTPDTVFELASVTKQFTATAVMLLIEEDKLKLDDLISRYLPRTPETWRGISVRHLLTHTAGLPGLREGFRALWEKGWQADYTTAAMFDAATKDPLIGAPGERYLYSDIGYFLLGMIIESVSGQRYGTFLEERFWKPLGMTSTSLLDQWRILNHRAAGYTMRDHEVVNIRRFAQTELPSHYGVFSSVKDLVTWDTAVTAGRVLKPDSLTQLWTPGRLRSGALHPYASGWFLDDRRGHRVISHAGITGTEYARYPSDNMTVIVLTNLGRQIGPGTEAVNAWGLVHGVAGRYVPGLLLATVPVQPDPDPATTQRLAALLASVARGEQPAGMLPALRAALDAEAQRVLAERLRTLQSFALLACDELAQPAVGRRGDPVARRCYYRAVNASETRYYTFWLAPDGRVADVTSTLD